MRVNLAVGPDGDTIAGMHSFAIAIQRIAWRCSRTNSFITNCVGIPARKRVSLISRIFIGPILALQSQNETLVSTRGKGR